MSAIWLAHPELQEFLQEVRRKSYGESIDAKVCLVFNDSNPYKKNSVNFGSVKRASQIQRLFLSEPPDFFIVVSTILWEEILRNQEEREALLGYHLGRIVPEYEPEYDTSSGKAKPVKDEHGRISYSSEVKLDDAGNPIWSLLPIDVAFCRDHIEKYGEWFRAIL